MAKKGKKKGKDKGDEKKDEKEERLRFIQEQKELIQFEIQNNEERKKYLGKEHDSKIIHLDLTLKKIAALQDQMIEDKIEKRHKLEWQLYTKGDRLPDPSSVPEMNTYLHRWHEDDDTYIIENIPSKTDEVLGLLDILEVFIEDPIETTSEQQANRREVYENFCFELRHHMNEATFRLLRYMDKNMILKGLNEVNFFLTADNFTVYLWGLLPLPKPMVHPPPISRKCAFDKIKVSLSLPKHLDDIDFIVRALYLNYDHLSKISRSYVPVPEPEERTINMKERAEREKENLLRIQKEIVDVRLKNLNLLRTALINQINQVIPLIEDDKNKSKAKKKSTPDEREKMEKARLLKEKQEDYMDDLLKELELNPDGTPQKNNIEKDEKDKKKKKDKKNKGKKGKVNDESTDADTELANSESATESSSKFSFPPRRDKKKRKSTLVPAKKKRKKLTPEKELKQAMDRLKNLPLNPSAVELFSEQEELEEQNYIEYLTTQCEPGELNLRKYTIFGGLLELNLFIMLTQPYEHPEKYIISIIKLPPVLESLPANVLYESGDEVIEEEEEEEKENEGTKKSILQGKTSNAASIAAIRQSLKKSMEDTAKQQEMGLEGAEEEAGEAKTPPKKSKLSRTSKAAKVTTTSMSAHDSITSRRVSEKRISSSDPQDAEHKETDKKMSRLSSMIDPKDIKQKPLKTDLPLVKMEMKDGLVFFDEPILVVWNDEKKIWSTDSCENVEMDGQKLSFELKRCGTIAFATLRYCNLPFQSWDLRPNPKDATAELAITAKFLSVIFTIKDDGVSIKEIKRLKDMTGFKDLIGKFHTPKELVKIMQSKGIDIFPEHDAACYVDEIIPKYAIMEDHLYHCMAMISGIYNFHWSRWNLNAGRRKIIMLVREFFDRWHPPEPSTLVVTPSKSVFVDCTEWGEELSEEPIQGMKYYADLFQLIHDQMPLSSQKKLREISYKQKETVYELLTLTKVISFTTTVPENEKVEFVTRQKQKPPPKKKGKGKGKGKGKEGKEEKKGKKGKEEEEEKEINEEMADEEK